MVNVVYMAELNELTDYELGYIAGIIDGDGSLQMSKSKTRGQKRYTYHVRCTIANGDKSVLEYLQYICGGGCLFMTRQELEKPVGRYGFIRHKPQYRLTFAKYILENLLPKLILIIRRKHQELLLGAMYMMRGQPLSDSERGRMEEIFQELKKLNVKGEIQHCS